MISATRQTEYQTFMYIANARPQKIIQQRKSILLLLYARKMEDGMACPMPGVLLSRVSEDRQIGIQQE